MDVVKQFNLNNLKLTKYLFFTGKGGVGKTSTACAIAVNLADSGKKVMLISTDPASNLQDVFETPLTNKGVTIKEVPNLTVANFDPEQAAREYKESVVGPYRGKLPDVVIQNMEEQLSGSCTVEIAAFNEFSTFITDEHTAQDYDHIIFDTAPTGHTLRMLQLPSAWNNFINESTHGASCLGQLSGLEDKKEIYHQAVINLADQDKTTLILVTRPEISPLIEAARASKELKEIEIHNQLLIVNGLLMDYDDELSQAIYEKQRQSLNQLPVELKALDTFTLPLRPYNISGIHSIRAFLKEDSLIQPSGDELNINRLMSLDDLVEDINKSNKQLIFTMGKGGVGKTTIAAAIALKLANKGKQVHLTTTDPAAHLDHVVNSNQGITMSHIDEEKELANYKEAVLSKSRETMSEEDLAYIEEDLRSPCTQEIAVFRAFAELVKRSDDEVIVIDTAPTGHTLLLLDSTQSYHKEIERSQGDIPESVKQLLPKLRDSNLTEVVIVTLPEATPVHEAVRLKADLTRAGMPTKWWIINASFYAAKTTNALLQAKSSHEVKWINQVNQISNGHVALLKWKSNELKGKQLLEL